MLVWHAHGEEISHLPRTGSRRAFGRRGVCYETTEGLDAAFEAMDKAYSAGDALETARTTAAFKFHLDIHLGKEDAHLYRLVREHVPKAEQAKALGIMSSACHRTVFRRWSHGNSL